MTPTTITKNAIDLGSAIIKNNITENFLIPNDDDSSYQNNNNNNNNENNFFINNNQNDSIINHFINNSKTNNNTYDINNLAATITSIRTNVTRVLYMYFRNVSDEYGYGAATTIKPITTVENQTITVINSSNSIKEISKSYSIDKITTTTPIATATPTATATTMTSTLPTLHANAAKTINVALTETTTTKLKTNLLQTTEKALNTLSPFANENGANENANNTGININTTMSSIISSLSSSSSSSSSSSLPSSMANITNSTIATTSTMSLLNTSASASSPSSILTTAPSITYPSYRLAIRSHENCSALFTNYTKPNSGIFCNWAWDGFLCWPPTPAGALARMHCPSGYHALKSFEYANRKCELGGYWGSKPNGTYNPAGWTDFRQCYKPEVNDYMQLRNLNLVLDIAARTRTMEIVGLVISLLALIISLIIFCNFRTLRNNRTKIHRNLFIAMVFQVIIRLTLYLDQVISRGRIDTVEGGSLTGIENTPYLCEAAYVLLEYARTAMFMWMFIEGLYLHNMVTVAVFQGRFPHTIFSLIGWGMPIIMTTIWAICMAVFTDKVGDCLSNYNLIKYYWVLEGPRSVVICLNFAFLINIIRVLVVKLRQSQASDIEQTRKAVRAAIVLLPLLGITNLLQIFVPDVKTSWKFAIWSYVTHFFTSFQGFFIALIYCFLNGEVRTALLKSLTVYMSVRGHPEWAPKRASMFSGAYNTAPDTEAAINDGKRNESPPNKRMNGRKASTNSASAILTATQNNCRTHITTRLANGSGKLRIGNSAERRRLSGNSNNNNNGRRRSSSSGSGSGSSSNQTNGSLLWSLCFRGGQKVLRVPPATIPPESVVFELSEQ